MAPTKASPSPPRRRWRTVLLAAVGLVLSAYALLSVQGYYTLYRSATQQLKLPPIDAKYEERLCDGSLLPAKSIAIIGAGSAGSSAAYYLPQYGSPCQVFNVTIFERATYVGGRSTTVNLYDDPSAPPVELGASIFVEANRNLVSAVGALNLSLREPYAPPASLKYDLGVWDGSGFRLLVEADLPTWRLIGRLVWKYGAAPLRLEALKNEVVGRFLQLYSAPSFPFASLRDAAKALGLDAATSQTGAQLLAAGGVGAAYAADVVQASTRVNYAADLPHIHGLEALVSMAADGGPRSVLGGNWRIFAGMVGASGAALRLDTTATRVSRKPDGSFAVAWSPASQPAREDAFDAVVLAAPWHQTGIAVDPLPRSPPADVPFVHLHVTLFTSPFDLSGAYFGTSEVPAAVLTTLPVQGPGPPFLSISLLRTTTNPATGLEERAYKVFSLAPLDGTFLENILDLPAGATGQDAVSWRFDKLWQSYPVLEPTATFYGPEMAFGDDDDAGGGLWYTGGIEPFISTMETSSLAGRNVAALLARRFMQQAGLAGAAQPQAPLGGSRTEL